VFKGWLTRGRARSWQAAVLPRAELLRRPCFPRTILTWRSPRLCAASRIPCCRRHRRFRNRSKCAWRRRACRGSTDRIRNAAHRSLVHHLPLRFFKVVVLSVAIGLSKSCRPCPIPRRCRRRRGRSPLGISQHDDLLVAVGILEGARRIAMLVLRPLLDFPVADLGLRQSRRAQKARKQRRREYQSFHVSPRVRFLKASQRCRA
jgi:hypothetical protein